MTLDDLRIVKARIQRGGYVYEIRCADPDGIDHVLAAYSDLEAARARLASLAHVRADLRSLMIVTDQLLALGNRINSATEEQGSEWYATKSHMRAWAGEMMHILTHVQEMLQSHPRG